MEKSNIIFSSNGPKCMGRKEERRGKTKQRGSEAWTALVFSRFPKKCWRLFYALAHSLGMNICSVRYGSPMAEQ